MAKQTTQSSGKKKKAVWVSIHAPSTLKNSFVGETILKEPSDCVGRKLTLNMSTVMSDMKKQNLEVTLQIKSVVDKKAATRITGLALTKSYVKRLVRRGKSKVEHSFVSKTADGKSIRLKPVLVTNNKVPSSVATRLRNEIKASIVSFIESTNSVDVFDAIVNMKVQKDLKSEFSKIYPIKYIDFRVAHLLPASTGLDDVEEVAGVESDKEAVEAVAE